MAGGPARTHRPPPGTATPAPAPPPAARSARGSPPRLPPGRGRPPAPPCRLPRPGESGARRLQRPGPGGPGTARLRPPVPGRSRAPAPGRPVRSGSEGPLLRPAPGQEQRPPPPGREPPRPAGWWRPARRRRRRRVRWHHPATADRPSASRRTRGRAVAGPRPSPPWWWRSRLRGHLAAGAGPPARPGPLAGDPTGGRRPGGRGDYRARGGPRRPPSPGAAAPARASRPVAGRLPQAAERTMSNFLAVATVTAALQRLLEQPVAADVPGAKVTTDRPDTLSSPPTEPTVNLYLYQVVADPAWRNQDLPTRRADGSAVQRPQAALDLHYLISFYGDESELEPQRLLGSTVRTLHARPVVTRPLIQGVVDAAGAATNPKHPSLATTDLGDAVEVVRVCPRPIGPGGALQAVVGLPPDPPCPLDDLVGVGGPALGGRDHPALAAGHRAGPLGGAAASPTDRPGRGRDRPGAVDHGRPDHPHQWQSAPRGRGRHPGRGGRARARRRHRRHRRGRPVDGATGAAGRCRPHPGRPPLAGRRRRPASAARPPPM